MILSTQGMEYSNYYINTFILVDTCFYKVNK